MLFFFFNDTATTEIYTLSLHDALPIFGGVEPDVRHVLQDHDLGAVVDLLAPPLIHRAPARSEEHTSELQSRQYLVCRLLLEKKKIMITNATMKYKNPQQHPIVSRRKNC